MALRMRLPHVIDLLKELLAEFVSQLVLFSHCLLKLGYLLFLISYFQISCLYLAAFKGWLRR